MSEILTVAVASISCLAAIISVIIAKNTSKKNHELAKNANELAKNANDLQKENNRIQAGQKFFRWDDIERYVIAIVQQMNDDGFVPTYIYATSTKQAVVASMIGQRLLMETNTSIPISVGLSIRGKVTREGFDVKKLADWGCILFQKDLPINNSDKILIVKAHFGSGASVSTVIDYFCDKFNVKESNIRTACIAYPNDTRYKLPNYFCLIASDIWFPWGKNT